MLSALQQLLKFHLSPKLHPCTPKKQNLTGPHDNTTLIKAAFADLREQFKGARVVASTLDDYTHALLAAAPRLALPVVTGAGLARRSFVAAVGCRCC